MKHKKKIPLSAKVSEETTEQLQDLHEWLGLSKAEILTRAIYQYYQVTERTSFKLMSLQRPDDRLFFMNTARELCYEALDKTIEKLNERLNEKSE